MTVSASAEPAWGYIAILTAAIDEMLAVSTVSVAALDKAHLGECVAGIVENGADPVKNAGALTSSVLGCFGNAVGGAAGIVIGLVTSLASLLVTQIRGVIDTITGATEVTLTVAATAPTTQFIRVNPWRDAGSSAPRKIAPSGSTCIGSNTTGRVDAYRCFVGNGVYDPCFINPSSDTQFMCNPDSWFIADGPTLSFGHNHGGSPETIFEAVLTDGTRCAASSGAGPQGVPGYSTWAGSCQSSSRDAFVIWRVADSVTDRSHAPLIPPIQGGGQWMAAVQPDESSPTVHLVGVVKAYS